MKHPTELLPDYVLENLSPKEARLVEVHLEHCSVCRAELRDLRESLVGLAESVPEARAPQGNWEKIQARLTRAETAPPKSRAPWQAWLLAASFVVAATGFWWGFDQQQSAQAFSREQQKVAGWLSRPDVTTEQLLDAQGERLGSVLTLSDGRALFVMRERPPGGSSYQAWGQRGSERVSLGVSDGSLLEVPYTGFDTIGVSLEPRGGSPQPSQPLGRVPTSF